MQFTLEKAELYENIRDVAIKSGKVINMGFATIDIVHTTDNNLYVLEINSGVGATIFIESVEGGYEFIKNIYR